MHSKLKKNIFKNMAAIPCGCNSTSTDRDTYKGKIFLKVGWMCVCATKLGNNEESPIKLSNNSIG